MELILDSTFDEIMGLQKISEPLEILKILQCYTNYLDQVEFFIDHENYFGVRARFNNVVRLEKDFLFGLPPTLLLAEKLILSGEDSVCEVPLQRQISAGGNERALICEGSLTNVVELTIKNIFGAVIPSSISQVAKIKAYINSNNLVSVVDEHEIKPLKLQYFEKNLIFDRDVFLDTADFEYSEIDNGVGLRIKIVDNPKKFVVYDASSTFVDELKHFIQEKIPELKSLGVGLEILIWNKHERYSSVSRKVLSTAKQDLILRAYKAILAFIDTDVIKQKAIEIETAALERAAMKLDKRKESIEQYSYLTFGNGLKFKVPENEYETVILFSALIASNSLPIHHFEIHEYVSAEGIDSICSYKIEKDSVLKNKIAVEFEYKFGNFFRHGHPKQHVELIVCWVIDVKKIISRLHYMLQIWTENDNLLVCARSD